MHRLVDEFGSTRRKKQMISKEQAVVSPDAIGAKSRVHSVSRLTSEQPQSQVGLARSTLTATFRSRFDTMLAQGVPGPTCDG